MASNENNTEHTHELKIQVPESVQGGNYANQFMATHTPEEFILDFILASPPAGIVNARVVVSPGHAKRIAAALQENVARYESIFGEISTITPAAPQEHNVTH